MEHAATAQRKGRDNLFTGLDATATFRSGPPLLALLGVTAALADPPPLDIAGGTPAATMQVPSSGPPAPQEPVKNLADPAEWAVLRARAGPMGLVSGARCQGQGQGQGTRCRREDGRI